jgi:hypothetical protein
MSSLRQVQQGRPYQLPPRAQGIAPSPDEPLAAWQDNITRAAALAAAPPPHHQQQQQQQRQSEPKPQTLLSGATRAYLGVSPALVEELCLTAGVQPTAEPSTLSTESWAALFSAWQAWLVKLQSSSFNPSSCSSRRRFSVLGGYPSSHSSVHELLDGYYFSLQAGEVSPQGGVVVHRVAAHIRRHVVYTGLRHQPADYVEQCEWQLLLRCVHLCKDTSMVEP